jgi:hypothetical protein
MFTASNVHYEISDRTSALGAGGIGAMHLLIKRLGLIEAIDERLHLLKVHLPYHESDHVLNIAYNILCGGSCLEDLELLRNNEVYLDAMGAQRIPDPTTAGDFCRRFDMGAIQTLMQIINDVRVRVWQMQPKSFFREAIIDVDGTIAPTTGQCKEGMGISYKGVWGYGPLIVSLANTREPLYLANRGANRPSHEGASSYLNEAAELCERAGFASVLYRGDTDFTQTQYLDNWDALGRRFIFGIDAMPNLKLMANELPETSWRELDRPKKRKVKTEQRKRPVKVKALIVHEQGYKNIQLRSEQIAELPYEPTACKKAYRLVVVRKNLTIEQGEQALLDDIRYFFYITNDRTRTAEEIVYLANERCEQENLIEQLKNGVCAMQMPVDNLLSNWAYMVMASLAWSMKAWFALSLPETGQSKKQDRLEKHSVLTMEFKKFLNAFMLVPAQIVRTGRRIIYRLLAWNSWQPLFLRAVAAFSEPMKC